MVAPNLNAPLSAVEFESLREVSKGLSKRVVPATHKKRLLEFGYIKEGTGRLMMTDAGQLRLAIGR